MVAKAAKLALNVQVMRDHVRFRSEASSLTEVFKTLFAGAPRHPGELVARAQRLGVELPGPARLVDHRALRRGIAGRRLAELGPALEPLAQRRRFAAGRRGRGG